jgi:hypothetical protein
VKEDEDMWSRRLVGTLAVGVVLALPAVSLAEVWSVPDDFRTIQQAINSPDVVDGDVIEVGPGNYRGARITKAVTLRGSGYTYITGGPRIWRKRSYQAGFLFRGPKAESGSGAAIHNFYFKDVEFPIFASQWGAVVHSVTVRHNTMESPIQGITMWHADDWDVQYNLITDLRAARGGGIGILVGSYSGDDAFENRISHNEITGTVSVARDDSGGYNAAGIFVVSDHRGRNRGGLIEGNLVSSNTVALLSDTPDVVPVVGIDIADTRGWTKRSKITENVVTNNDLSGTAHDVELTPIKLDDVNQVQ